MQFAVPPRRSPHPLPIARSSRMPTYRRKQLKSVAILAFAILLLLYIIHHLYSTSTSVATSASTSGVVIVTLLDRQRFSESYINKIVANREDYAKRHGKGFWAQLTWYQIRSNLFYEQGIQTSSQMCPTSTTLSAMRPRAGLLHRPFVMLWLNTLARHISFTLVLTR